MNAQDQNPISIQIHRAIVHPLVRVEIVGVPLALEPCQQPPFRWRHTARQAALDRVGRFYSLRYKIAGLRAIERQRPITTIGRSPLAEAALQVSLQILTRVY